MSAATPLLKPLANKTILVACSALKMAALTEGLGALGAKVIAFPVIEAEEIPDKHALDEALDSLSRYAWIVFTSSHGVIFFFRRIQERGIGRHALKDLKICAVGPATARTLREHEISVTLVPKQFVAEGVLQALKEYYGGLRNLTGLRILFPRAKEGRDMLPNALCAAGAEVDVVPCYQTVRAQLDETTIREVKAKMPQVVVFTSSSTVRNLIETLGMDTWEMMGRESAIAALGPITAATVESFGQRAAVLPKQSTITSLIEAIRQWALGSSQAAVDG